MISGRAWVFGDDVVRSVVFGLAWIGVILLLVVIGYETDLAIIARFRKAAGWVSAGGFLLPMAVLGTAAWLVPEDFVGEGIGFRVLLTPGHGAQANHAHV